MIKKIDIKTFTGIAALGATVVVLQFISNYINFNGVSITLALTPIAIGAIIYGPLGGAILGSLMGIVVMVNSSAFFAINPFATVLVCLLKSGLAGFVSGYVFLLFKKNNIHIAAILASIIVPVVNTGIFALCCPLFFKPFIEEVSNGKGTVYTLFMIIIGVNFIIEFIVNSVLAPTIYRIVKIYNEKSSSN